MKKINTKEEWLLALKKLDTFTDCCEESDVLTNLIVEYEMMNGLIPSSEELLKKMECEEE